MATHQAGKRSHEKSDIGGRHLSQRSIPDHVSHVFPSKKSKVGSDGVGKRSHVKSSTVILGMLKNDQFKEMIAMSASNVCDGSTGNACMSQSTQPLQMSQLSASNLSQGHTLQGRKRPHVSSSAGNVRMSQSSQPLHMSQMSHSNVSQGYMHSSGKRYQATLSDGNGRMSQCTQPNQLSQMSVTHDSPVFRGRRNKILPNSGTTGNVGMLSNAQCSQFGQGNCVHISQVTPGRSVLRSHVANALKSQAEVSVHSCLNPMQHRLVCILKGMLL